MTPILVGLAAVAFSALYVLSDTMETVQGGFSDTQLVLTLIAEAAIPIVVLGLYALQRPRIGRLGLVSAVAYAYCYVFFTGTVVYAMVRHTGDYSALTAELGASMTVHGAIMVAAGIGFGLAVIRASVFPAWTGAALIVGVLAVAATQSSPEAIQLVAAGIRAAALAGMGIALIQGTGRNAEPHPAARQECDPSG